MDRVEKLAPNVYNPLSAWVKTSIASLDNHTPTEIWSDLNASPPTVNLRVEFALLGTSMKLKVSAAQTKYNEFNKLRGTVHQEFRSRLTETVKALKAPSHWPPDWTVYNVFIEMQKANNEKLASDVLNFAQSYPPLDKLREIAASSKVTIRYSGQNAQTDCPPDLIEKMTHTDDLTSYKKFIQSRTELRSDLESLNLELNYAIEHGEKDW